LPTQPDGVQLKFISPSTAQRSVKWTAKLDQLWAERNSFHNLRPSIESEQKKLEEKARSNLTLLNELEQTLIWAWSDLLRPDFQPDR
jgi:hypothetical protein